MESIGGFLWFSLTSLAAALGSLLRPREFLRQWAVMALGALPLGLVAGGALGVVVWVHLHGVVSQQYAHKVPEYLALAVVLEFAPLGAGLVMAGRSGASLAAELAAMKLTEQIDALEVLGMSPERYLVGPRVLASLCTLPLLTVYIGALALGGSFVAEMLGGALSPTQYQTDLMLGLSKAPVIGSILKTAVFGYLVGVAGCWCGLRASGGADGVGHAATSGVVLATLLVLGSNVVLVQLQR